MSEKGEVAALNQTFVITPRTGPVKTPAMARVRDFAEIQADFTAEAGTVQASRCAQCGVPFCQTGCPLQNNIPDWLRLAAEGRAEEAWRQAEATSTMPEICGRICPQDRLCEGACTLEQSGWETVTIGSVERWLGDMAFENGWVEPIRPRVERAQSVGIIGAGPAGMAAADRLRSAGYAVTIYDRHDRAGGLLMYGIPGFKLEKPVVQRRLDRLVEGGVTFRLGVDVGGDLPFADVRAAHDAVLVATGVYQARRLTAPGCGSTGVIAALDYLIASNRKGLGDAVADFDSGALNAAGKRVVVVGGGDTAMDCVRTAVRQGAASVTCLYRRDRDNMPGSAREVTHAEEEGVVFEWLAAPRAVLGEADRVTGVRGQRMALAAPSADGRWSVEPVPGGEFDLPADLVLEALGFEPEDMPDLLAEPDLAVTEWRTIRTAGRTRATTLEGVFAAGDIVRGASLVVWAVRDGQDAAAEIDAWLRGRERAAA
ncbi:MAG: NAD(P)-dependent oxidoreductase [Alphaproteobacteria bacterium]|jgi:glutamate synthase (NADPH) small chain|nr:NAD(P)-dependent oxidoreductase [Alphaproteobacteria bacterium]MBU2042528.1 NAD(P)-dependent oxidoreductase [Alphaproteobacteria bacterium]MBU2207875.1 NAD(P)-dependent oxidoreductase [Alphaproteobacteria bacterium]MBU2292377.1 NAD(P)-dependent oxidoreductase [Alphaproteobacteria bacterium]MBU2395922.1 NAD(P)-dependent oxidoreductase [Alphaproteobacteria bacterium]